jgi:hypothetical protein
MRIGLTAIYAWRPHVEHLHYLSDLLKGDGHSISFLKCNSDVDKCYAKLLRSDRTDFMNCLRCNLGGINSFETKGIKSIGDYKTFKDSNAIHYSDKWAYSSASTLGRFEVNSDFESDDFKHLAKSLDDPTKKAYLAACAWIKSENLEAIILFNGRMDLTRGVLEAAKTCGIPFLSLERTWFGDGLQLLPNENCLGLKSINQMMREWRGRPLTKSQAFRASTHIASRWLGKNQKEWRAYNTSPKLTNWPIRNSKYKILLVPGSRNEVWGHPDWDSQWLQHTDAIDLIIKKLALKPNDLLLRCHPNWAEKIGLVDGSRCEQHYVAWAKKRGVQFIPSSSTVSTLSLIEQADAIIVCGGSAALEAGLLGKQVIATTPSIYDQAGFQTDAKSLEDINLLSLNIVLPPKNLQQVAESITRQTLRFLYTMVYRVPQFVDHVRCIDTTNYEYLKGASAKKIVDTLMGGQLSADDDSYAENSIGEDEVLELIRLKKWGDLIFLNEKIPNSQRQSVRRRWLYRWMDGLRNLFPRGDL